LSLGLLPEDLLSAVSDVNLL